MKNLKLESFGVQEMDAKGMQNIEGGNPIVLGALALAVSAGAAGMAAGYYLGKAWYYSTH